MSTRPGAAASAEGRATARALRTFVVPSFTFESGEVLHDLRQAYHLDGTLNAARDNLVVVFHALTGTPDAAGDWWKHLIGPGLALDTDRYAVLVPNLLGSCYGTSGPSVHPDERFPRVTPRDQARFAAHLVDALGVHDVALVTGGSLGGMVALEWTAQCAGRTRTTVVLAAPAAHTAHAIAWNAVQRAVLDAAGDAGLAVARQISMIAFRSEREFEARFGRTRHSDGRFNVESYLAHQGRKLEARFDATSYRLLLDAMDAHDLGRGRGGVAHALRGLQGHIYAVGVPGDQLYSADVVRQWAELAGAEYRELTSHFGHDAFLLEHEQVGAILHEALQRASRADTQRDVA
ncbi:MAG: homoserine O-acetyltransferase [Gemmatimonadaceae bacterium]|nr:homoserine O-acetyltransferase [Gemmatimonadaceae bacterium]